MIIILPNYKNNFILYFNTIINSIDRNNTDNKIIQCLEQIEDKQYSNSSEVVSAAGLTSR